MSKEITFYLDDETYKKFDIALSLNDTECNIVLENFCKTYIADSFSREAKKYSSNSTIEASKISDKVTRKVPLWATRKGQVCYNIIRGYLQLADEQNGLVSAEDLFLRCSDQNCHPDTFVSNFNPNFQQMRLNTAKSHGHVFDLANGYVIICANAQSTIEQWKDKFLE